MAPRASRPSDRRPARHALYDAATRLDSLERAWHRVRANAGAAGGDGLTVTQFDDGAAVRLLSLHKALRDGSYAPGPLRRVAVPKRDGGERVLTIPCVRDRVVQTAVTDALVPVLEPAFEEVSFAYRPGRSVAQAVARIQALRRAGHTWVVDGDIERYFDRVPHAPLLAVLETHIDDPALMDLIAVWLEHAGEGGAGLPQGSPLSPLLSNLYLDALDEEALAATFGPGVRLVRYADDFVLLCRSEAAARRALAGVGTALERLGLSLNPDKTRIVSFDQGFRFLGHLFVKSLVMPSPGGEPAEDDPATAVLRAIARQDAAETAAEARRQEEEAAGLAAVTRVLYIMEPGRRLGLRNQSLTVEEAGHDLLAIGPGRAGRVEIGPGAGFDDEALRACLLDDIPVHLVDGWGRAVGACLPAPRERAGLHLAQARLVLDEGARTEAARALVAARIHNQRALLRRLNRSLKDTEVTKAAARIGRILRKVAVKGDVAAVLGVEGEATALYWPALARLLRAPWRLDRRLRRPPPDPVNLVLSWLSALLTREVEVLVVRHGLHPGFGVLHGTRDYHAGCVFDLLEPLRGPLPEAATLTLFNQRHLKPDHFLTTEDGHCRVMPEGRRTILREWEAWLDRPIQSPRSGRRLKWRGLMEEEVLSFARHAAGDHVHVPYRMDY
ncbi:CRISPR-associated endonuclease Cas1 [Roseospira goensis]|uniref:CRISPR-associated endonuclease Cas1 n=1 Tax=Roseospira goensis TaxID=391922 RepID=A0A7W6RY77_9PROT|nr:CRISPR-associated endonuclease Cas1 [Roseospira goensis]MBB4285424.1 CRISPR-associated protein Cas1 [Roseospira goensis]